MPAIFDRRSRDRLAELAYPHVYVEVPKGRHILNVVEGEELMNGAHQWLTGKRRNAHPKHVRFHSLGETMPQAYWIRIDARGEPDVEVEARIEKGNHIVVTSRNTRRLTLYLDEEHLDLERPVTVTVNRKRAFEGVVAPSSVAVLASWRAREDRQLLYRAAVTIDTPDRSTGQ